MLVKGATVVRYKSPIGLVNLGHRQAERRPNLLPMRNRLSNNVSNTLRPIRNGRHFADDTLKCIFLNGNIRISINISLKFVPKVPVNNIPVLVQIMACRRPGDKPLSEPMMIRLPTHIYMTRFHGVNIRRVARFRKISPFISIIWSG